MRITAQDLVRFGVVDTIVPEPTGGAHRDRTATIAAAGEALDAAFAGLKDLDAATIVRMRQEKFMAIGRTLG
jgi:acetyl-CoA carboxylase carboxyl transferase subunit alpha